MVKEEIQFIPHPTFSFPRKEYAILLAGQNKNIGNNFFANAVVDGTTIFVGTNLWTTQEVSLAKEAILEKYRSEFEQNYKLEKIVYYYHTTSVPYTALVGFCTLRVKQDTDLNKKHLCHCSKEQVLASGCICGGR